MKTENLQLLMKCCFNKGLVMFDNMNDKEMKFFDKTKQLNVKTPVSQQEYFLF